MMMEEIKVSDQMGMGNTKNAHNTFAGIQLARTEELQITDQKTSEQTDEQEDENDEVAEDLIVSRVRSGNPMDQDINEEDDEDVDVGIYGDNLLHAQPQEIPSGTGGKKSSDNINEPSHSSYVQSSRRTSGQVQIPTTTQYSPARGSDKSPLGFTTTPEGGGGLTSSENPSQSQSQLESARSMDKSQMIGDEYCLLKDLGEGTFGNVKLGKHLSSGQLVAVKILEKKRITDQADVERVIREIKILKSIRHPHIIKLYEIIETKARIFLIMEYACGGELFDYIVRKDRLSEKEACRFYNQVVSGIEFLHSKGIAHRDLKPENLLLDKQKNLKIVDFGLSNTYKTGQTLKTACGSPCYAAPEMIAGRRYNGLEVDIWSSGVTLYAMLCGFLPFEDPDTALLYKKILKGEFELPDFLSSRSIKFLKELLCTDPTKRLTLKQIKSHQWYTQFEPKTQDPFLERTAIDKSRLALSQALDQNQKACNSQIYGAKGNSSLVENQLGQNGGTTTNSSLTIPIGGAVAQNRVTNDSQGNNTTLQQQKRPQYFAQTNQTVSSSMSVTAATKTVASHQKSISEANVPVSQTAKASMTMTQAPTSLQAALQSRPSTSLKKSSAAVASGPTSKVSSTKTTAKRPKQTATLSAIICSPRQTKNSGAATNHSKRSTDDFIETSAIGTSNHNQHRSERKPATSKNMKEKLRTLKNGKIDNVLTQEQKQVVNSSQKVRSQKVPPTFSMLNNTMPMPKLMIDLASPSTGGSTDVHAVAQKNAMESVVSKQHQHCSTATNNYVISRKDAFKNNLARVAKNQAQVGHANSTSKGHNVHETRRTGNSSTVAQSSSHAQQVPHNQASASKPTKSVSLKKQMLNQHLIGQMISSPLQLIQNSRSVIGGAGAGSAHSSLSNKRQKSPRVASQSSSNTVRMTSSASKSIQGNTKLNKTPKVSAHAQMMHLNFSLMNSNKQRNKNGTLKNNLQSVHPYTVMAMPHFQSQNNLKESTSLVQSTTAPASKKSTNRNSLGGGPPQPTLTKMPKTFIKSHQSLQDRKNTASVGSTSPQQRRQTAMTLNGGTSNMQLSTLSMSTRTNGLLKGLNNNGTNAVIHKTSTSIGGYHKLDQQRINHQQPGGGSHHTNSVESQVRSSATSKIELTATIKKAPSFMSEYSNALYNRAILQDKHRQVQSLEVLKVRKGSIDMLQPMRVCQQSAASPEWMTSESPQLLLDTLEALLPMLNVQFVQRKSPFLFEIKLARPLLAASNGGNQAIPASQSLKCELELMLLKNAPFITVIRLNQKVKLKSIEDAATKESIQTQYNQFCQRLRQGLKLDKSV